MEKKPIVKTRKGVVVSNRMDKTAVVRVERVFRHPLFQKTLKSYKRFKAHDPENKCKIGDVVIITETRPLSREKCWKIDQVVGFEKVIERKRPGPLHKKPETVSEEKKDDSGPVQA